MRHCAAHRPGQRPCPTPPIGRLVGPGGLVAGVQGRRLPATTSRCRYASRPGAGCTEHDSGPERLSCSGVAAIPRGDEAGRASGGLADIDAGVARAARVDPRRSCSMRVLGAPLDQVFLMKLYAARDCDLDDLRALWPLAGRLLLLNLCISAYSDGLTELRLPANWGTPPGSAPLHRVLRPLPRFLSAGTLGSAVRPLASRRLRWLRLEWGW